MLKENMIPPAADKPCWAESPACMLANRENSNGKGEICPAFFYNSAGLPMGSPNIYNSGGYVLLFERGHCSLIRCQLLQLDYC